MCAVTTYVLHAYEVREPHAVRADTKSECEPQWHPGNITDLTGGGRPSGKRADFDRNIADQRPFHSRSGKTEGR